MRFINFLIILILCSASSAYSGEYSSTKNLLNEYKTNSMVEIKTPVLKEETVPTSSTQAVSKIISPIAEDVKNTPSIIPQPILENKIEPSESKVEIPEIKAPVKIESKPKTEEKVQPAENLNSNIINIVSTADGKSIYAQLKVTEESQGLMIQGTFKGVPNPGMHGIHIHENGSCADKGNGAGGHFNPDNHQHGDLKNRGHAEAHAGDMGNVEIDSNGNGDFTFLLIASSLKEGRYNVAGKAIILHEKMDDFGQPTGNAGGRIGCGIIPNP